MTYSCVPLFTKAAVAEVAAGAEEVVVAAAAVADVVTPRRSESAPECRPYGRISSSSSSSSSDRRSHIGTDVRLTLELAYKHTSEM